MKILLFLAVVMTVSFPNLLAASEKTVPVIFAAAEKSASFEVYGRNMRAVKVQGGELRGCFPDQPGEYAVMSGSHILREGRAGQEFNLQVPPGCRKLYLRGNVSAEWKPLQWSGDEKIPLAMCSKVITVNAADFGVSPGETDAAPALRRLIDHARMLDAGGVEKIIVSLPRGVYHFYPSGAHLMSLYISNHDQQDFLPVGIPLVDVKNIELDGQGSTFVFHGLMQPILIMDSSNVTCRNISIDYATPFYAEGKIVAIEDGKTTLEIPERFSWCVEDGKFYTHGDGWKVRAGTALGFHEDGRMVATGRAGDAYWGRKATQVSENRVQFEQDARRLGFDVGQVLVLRIWNRPYPAMVLHQAEDTRLENVVFHSSQGMALLAQMSRDVTIRGGGCVRGDLRVHTAGADATHFSNCGGHISVQNALYEGMLDDAINVHSTCLSIERVLSPTQVELCFMHPQAVGFNVFPVGSTLQYIRGKTLENHPSLGKAVGVERVDECTVRLTLEQPLPEGIGVGDSVENADFYPSVDFAHNIVRSNRARGSLFTTPKPVVVEGNKFIGSSGSAILLAGDAQGWYESGRCRNVVIRNNLFEHNLICRYQFTEGIISIYPEVKEPASQKERYHENILIENNTFITHRVPLIYAISADNIIFRNNKVTVDDKYAPMHDGKPFILKHCGKWTSDYPGKEAAEPSASR
ncbi:MAG: right-handed parallel beta-helix repeat-containing protein [Akkermansia sp.]|nr:right-handed parallel beta-helix repeat-containing protein [Akkermansia sp.]